MQRFKEFLEVTHGNHEPKKYGNTYDQLKDILKEIGDRRKLVIFALNCVKDTGINVPEVKKCIELIEGWLKGEKYSWHTTHNAYHNTYDEYPFAAYAVYSIEDPCSLDDALTRVTLVANNTARLWKNEFEAWKHYIAIAQGLVSSSSKFKSKIIQDIDENEDYIEKLAVAFDEIEENPDNEATVEDTPNGKCLNLPRFIPPISVCGKDNFDLAKQIYNSKLRHSLFNYINHLHK